MKEQKICDEVEKTVPSAAEQETSRASPQGCHGGTHGMASNPTPGDKQGQSSGLSQWDPRNRKQPRSRREEASTPLPPDSFCAARVNCQLQFFVLALCQMRGDRKFLWCHLAACVCVYDPLCGDVCVQTCKLLQVDVFRPLTESELTISTPLTSQLISGSCVLGLHVGYTHLTVHMASRDLNSGPHACAAKALSTEPFPQILHTVMRLSPPSKCLETDKSQVWCHTSEISGLGRSRQKDSDSLVYIVSVRAAGAAYWNPASNGLAFPYMDEKSWPVATDRQHHVTF